MLPRSQRARLSAPRRRRSGCGRRRSHARRPCLQRDPGETLSSARGPGDRALRTEEAARCRREGELPGETTHSCDSSREGPVAGARGRGAKGPSRPSSANGERFPPGGRARGLSPSWPLRIGSSSEALRRLGWWRGCEERSRTHPPDAISSALALKRRCHQRCAVAGETLRAAAAALNDIPWSIRSQRAMRPAGPRAALA